MIKAQTIIALGIAQLLSPAAPASRVYEIQPFHSQVEFAVPFMGLATVKGAFEEFSGALLYDEKHPEASAVSIVMQAASLHSGNSLRDKHLRSDDFLDAERFPTLLFESLRVEQPVKGSLRVFGNLTMHGVTKALTIPVRVRHDVRRDQSGVDYIGFDATLKLDWRDFGIQATNRNNSWFQPSKMLVNDSVSVTLAIQGTLRHPSKVEYPTLAQAKALWQAGGLAAITDRLAATTALGADSLSRFARPLGDLGGALVEDGHVADGVRVLQLNVDAHPNDADALVLLARGHLVAGNRAEALATFDRTFKIDSLQPEARLMRSRIKTDN